MDQLGGWLTGFLAILLFSSFVKIFTTLSIMRFGLGLKGASFGLVFFALAITLTFLSAYPQLEKVGGPEAVLSARFSNEQALMKEFKPFMIKHADPALTEKLTALVLKRQPSNASNDTEAGAAPSKKDDTSVLMASFLLTELREALELGLIIIVPFIVIDLLVANFLLLLGVVQMPYAVIALPLKLLLFWAMDGWQMVSEKLLAAYLN